MFIASHIHFTSSLFIHPSLFVAILLGTSLLGRAELNEIMHVVPFRYMNWSHMASRDVETGWGFRATETHTSPMGMDTLNGQPIQ